MASTIEYVCNFSPKACSVVFSLGLPFAEALTEKIGVPVNPKLSCFETCGGFCLNL